MARTLFATTLIITIVAMIPFAALLLSLTFLSCTKNGFEFMLGEQEQAILPQTPTSGQFTSDAGRNRNPDWSPDGEWIAFNSDRSGNRDIWIKRVSDGQARQSTHAPAVDRVPRWSPDGQKLLFASDRGGHWNLWTVASFDQNKILERITTDADELYSEIGRGLPAAWSPDGEEIVFSSTRDDHYDLWIIPASGGPARPLNTGFGYVGDPDWSPDGRFIAFNAADSFRRSGRTDLWIIPASGGQARPLTTDAVGNWNPSFSPDGEWIAFISKRRNQYMGLWIMPATGGIPLERPNTPDQAFFGPRWSPDGRLLTFDSFGFSSADELWIGPATGGGPTLLTDDEVTPFTGGHFSPDGRWIAFVRQGPEGRDIWKMPAAGGEAVQLTQGGLVADRFAALSFSPDGKLIAFNSEKDGQSNVWVVPAEGGQARRITLTVSGSDFWMSFSPDSRRIAYTSNKGGQWDIWVVPAAGGVAERLVDWPSIEWGPNWSPDGANIAFVSGRTQAGEGDVGPWNIWVYPVSGGEATHLTEGAAPTWSPDGRKILFSRKDITGITRIWSISSTGDAPARQLEMLGAGSRPRYSPDGLQVLFARGAGTTYLNSIWTDKYSIWIADMSMFLASLQ